MDATSDVLVIKTPPHYLWKSSDLSDDSYRQAQNYRDFSEESSAYAAKVYRDEKHFYVMWVID